MTAKTSISLTDAQEAYARKLVARGSYSSLSAVLQHGLELLRARQESDEIETDALRALLDARRQGKFIEVKEAREHTRRMIAARKAGK